MDKKKEKIRIIKERYKLYKKFYDEGRLRRLIELKISQCGRDNWRHRLNLWKEKNEGVINKIKF